MKQARDHAYRTVPIGKDELDLTNLAAISTSNQAGVDDLSDLWAILGLPGRSKPGVHRPGFVDMSWSTRYVNTNVVMYDTDYTLPRPYAHTPSAAAKQDRAPTNLPRTHEHRTQRDILDISTPPPPEFVVRRPPLATEHLKPPTTLR